MTDISGKPMTISFSSPNIVAGTNNSKMSYTFPCGSVDITNKKIALIKSNVYYSFPAVTTATSFTYTWWDGTDVTVTLAANTTYSADDLNLLLQYYMEQNHHFLYDTNTSPDIPVYYASIVPNPVAYAIDLQSELSPVNLTLAGSGYDVPFDYHLISSMTVTGGNLLTITCANTTADGAAAITAGQTFLISGCTNANNLQWNNQLLVAATANATTVTVTVAVSNYAASAETVAKICPPTTSGAPLWIFPSTRANLQFNLSNATVLSILGFTAGSYPSTPTGTQANYAISSNNGSPQVNPYSLVRVMCNWVYEPYNTYQNQIFEFAIDVEYGQNIQSSPPQWSWFRTARGARNTIEVQLTDQNGIPLVVLDPMWSMSLQIRDLEPNEL